MATAQQTRAATQNIRQAQMAWRLLSPRAHALAQPEGRGRKRPGAGEGSYFRIAVRPKDEFVTFRTQDVGMRGHIQRVAGKRRSGSWDTQTWLISKHDAHVAGGQLIPDTADAQKILEQLGSRPRHASADRFVAKPRPDVPEYAKPTRAMRRAQRRNIRKAQSARRSTT